MFNVFRMCVAIELSNKFRHQHRLYKLNTVTNRIPKCSRVASDDCSGLAEMASLLTRRVEIDRVVFFFF